MMAPNEGTTNSNHSLESSNSTSTDHTANTNVTATTSTSANNIKKNNETTLTQLTKRFVKLLNSKSERVINLNEASARLEVAKRRIYDITNVLEGIGLLQKESKNVTKWIDCPRDSPLAAKGQPQQLQQQPQQQQQLLQPPSQTPQPPSNINQNGFSNGTAIATALGLEQDNINILQAAGFNLTGPIDAELLALSQTYQKLEEGINDLNTKIGQQSSAEGAYVTYHDIKSSFNDLTVIAVKPSLDTRLEVNEDLQIAIKSEKGEIEVYLYQHSNSNYHTINNTTQQQLQNGYQTNTSPHLQQSQLSNSSNTQLLDATFTNTNNLIGQQQQQQQPFTSVSSDEGRGRSTVSTNDGVYYDPTSGVSTDDHYYNDPTLSSALSGMSEDEDPFRPLVLYEGREETHYNFVLDDNDTVTSLFLDDNLGLYH